MILHPLTQRIYSPSNISKPWKIKQHLFQQYLKSGILPCSKTAPGQGKALMLPLYEALQIGFCFELLQAGLKKEVAGGLSKKIDSYQWQEIFWLFVKNESYIKNEVPVQETEEPNKSSKAKEDQEDEEIASKLFRLGRKGPDNVYAVFYSDQSLMDAECKIISRYEDLLCEETFHGASFPRDFTSLLFSRSMTFAVSLFEVIKKFKAENL